MRDLLAEGRLDIQTVGIQRLRAFKVKMDTLHRFLGRSMIVLAGLALGCTDTVEIPGFSCPVLFTTEPTGLVVPVGGSERLRVQLRDVDRIRDPHPSCPVAGHGWRELITWTVLDPSLARVEKYGAGVVTITGLAVGTTRIRVQYGVVDEICVPLEVVESQLRVAYGPDLVRVGRRDAGGNAAPRPRHGRFPDLLLQRLLDHGSRPHPRPPASPTLAPPNLSRHLCL